MFIAAHLLVGGKRPEKTLTFVQQMALRIGTMHVLVVAPVFSILTGELIKHYVFYNLNAMAENHNKRIIEWQAPNLPPIFLGIGVVRYLLTLNPCLCVHEPPSTFPLPAIGQLK